SNETLVIIYTFSKIYFDINKGYVLCFQFEMSDYWHNKKWILDPLDGYITNISSTANSDIEMNVIIYRMRITRRASGLYTKAFIYPSFLILILTLLIFWLPPTAGERIVLGCFIISMLLAFLMYFARTMPPTKRHV